LIGEGDYLAKQTADRAKQSAENGKLGGCPPKYTSADDLSAKVEAFIADCQSGKIEEPSDYEIVNYFGISPRTLDRYRADYNADDSDNKDSCIYKGFGEALKKIDLYREHATLLEVKHNPKMTGHAAFKLKQPHWGNWSDKPAESNNKTSIEVTLKTI
jgi:hypothetical protein